MRIPICLAADMCRTRVALAVIAMLVLLSSESLAWDKKGSVYTTDGSQEDVVAAINDAQDGDTVMIPAGSFTYGANRRPLVIRKPITLKGAGRDKTTIVVADTSGVWTNAAIRLCASATIRDLTVKGSPLGRRAPFAATKSRGWRITNVEFVQTQGKGSYFLYVGDSFGLVDNCKINGAAGNNELIFARGPADAWQTDSTIGTADNVYIEDCIFDGRGYVCDINSNGKAVVRFCTINGPMKVDGHGKASNSPARGVRHMEVYHNTWTDSSKFWLTVEMRGGTGHIFNNTAAGGAFMLRDYAYSAKWPNFGRRFLLPKDYPIDDQIGTGKDPKKGGSEPMYVWRNRMTNGSQWVRANREAHKDAIELNGGKAFHDSDLIAQDRDFYRELADRRFDGSSGVGVGTQAQMKTIRPTRKGVGFWVTDKGNWNKKTPGPDGRLYVWSGRDWVAKYTPYTYPHPLRSQNTKSGADPH